MLNSDLPRLVVRGARSPLGGSILDALRARFDIVETDLNDQHVNGSQDGGRNGAHREIQSGFVDSIVDVGIGDYDALGSSGSSATVAAAQLVAEADRVGARHLVVVSSAMVYGAVANNPIPISEDAVLRPDPSFVFARQLAAAEEMIEAWRQRAPGRSVSMLRPVVPVAEQGTSALAAALTAGFGQRLGEADPGAQFVHHDDIASAVVLAVTKRLDGAYNVAPIGAIPGERVRALSGRRWAFPMPERANEVLAALRWRFQRGPIPPGLAAYTRHSWVVASDKLRAEGWQPTVTNEEAYVEGTEARWWTMITPQRRQELALGGLVAVLGGVGIAGAVALRRWVRARRR